MESYQSTATKFCCQSKANVCSFPSYQFCPYLVCPKLLNQHCHWVSPTFLVPWSARQATIETQSSLRTRALARSSGPSEWDPSHFGFKRACRTGVQAQKKIAFRQGERPEPCCHQEGVIKLSIARVLTKKMPCCGKEAQFFSQWHVKSPACLDVQSVFPTLCL